LAQFSWTIMENGLIHTSVDTLEGMIRKKKTIPESLPG